jgi:hypothetical protein
MSTYYGDFPDGHPYVCMTFDTFAAAGGSVTMTGFAASDILVYKNGNATPRASASGIVVVTDFNGKTGLHMVTFDLSDNADAGFYSWGNEYSVAVADVTVDGLTVRFWLGSFSIERLFAPLYNMNSRFKTTGNARAIFSTIGRGTVTTGATTTSLPTTNFKPDGAATDQFQGRVVLFDENTTTAGLRGCARLITASSNAANPTLTVDTLPATPVSGDKFSVV